MREEITIIPKMCGNYLIGNTTFNPYTDEKYYWVKVGTGNDLNSRLKSYNTHTPATFIIDLEILGIPLRGNYPTKSVKATDKLRKEKENNYHFVLRSFFEIEDVENRKRTSTEWFRVTREDYLTICKYGFKYLEKIYNNFYYHKLKSGATLEEIKTQALEGIQE